MTACVLQGNLTINQNPKLGVQTKFSKNIYTTFPVFDKKLLDGEEMKAISQNFGHEHIATTLSSYANYHPQRIADIIKNMDFSGKPKETLVDQVKELIKKIEKRDNACRD